MKWFVTGVVFVMLYVAGAAGPVVDAAEAQTPRERIANYILFYYVGEPNNPDPRYLPQSLDPADLLAGREEADFWRDADIPGLKDLVRALVDEPPDEDLRRFQRMVADLLDVRGKRVAVYLIDDAGQPLADGGVVADERYGASVDDAGTGVWPSAVDDGATSLRGSPLAGSFSTGEVNLRSAADARSTFLHELTHVQAVSDGRPHLFSIGGTDYTYGLDGSHDGRELIPDLSTAYDEAVAGALQMLYEPGLVAEALEGLGPDGVVLVEKAVPNRTSQRGARVLDDIWLYDQLRDLGIPELKTTDPNFAAFDIGDVPGRFLVHNETAMAVVLAESARRTAGYRALLRALYHTNAVVERAIDERGAASGLTVNEIGTLLPALGREILGRDDPGAALVSGGDTSHLLPLALFDYFTGRDATTASEFGDLFRGQLDPDWLSAYWEVGRPLLDQVLPPVSRTPRTLDNVTAIAGAFNRG